MQSLKETHSYAPSFNPRCANIRRANLRRASGDPPSYRQNPLFNGLDIQKHLCMKYRIAIVNVGILQGGNFENGRITPKHKLYLPGT